MMAGLRSTWSETGGDSDGMRGMVLAPNQTRTGATETCDGVRKERLGNENLL